MKRVVLLVVTVLIFGLLTIQFWNCQPIFLRKYGVDKIQSLIIYQSGLMYYVWESRSDYNCMFAIDLQHGKYYLYTNPHFDPTLGGIFFKNLGYDNGGVDMSTGLFFDREVPVVEGNQVTIIDPHQRGKERRITITLKESDVPQNK